MSAALLVWWLGALWFGGFSLYAMAKQQHQPVPMTARGALFASLLWPIAAVVSLHVTLMDYLEDDWND